MKPAIKSEKFVVMVHGSADELAKAKDIFTNMGHDVQVHSA
jgi:3-hydroxyisobutyrate dehydrogenase-like beta-hydroxyacid dehydrogenase